MWPPRAYLKVATHSYDEQKPTEKLLQMDPIPTTTEIPDVAQLTKTARKNTLWSRETSQDNGGNGRGLNSHGESAQREGGSADANQFQSQELVDP